MKGGTASTSLLKSQCHVLIFRGQRSQVAERSRLPSGSSRSSRDSSMHISTIKEGKDEAEEFLKMAKEKTDDVAEGAKETVQETKEVVLGESDDDMDKFKQRVEQGSYDQK
ncbi:unnamed protein product [Triticum turgidum subsp. durum]|uniref:Uncharacterized protein n=1 Tax=Triticum turgidum subsp. durum TaxID=4567 RepID=A0A9R0SD50_TRITD|nr:unnamed protein product [Triticum turgidum subsp. durum]